MEGLYQRQRNEHNIIGFFRTMARKEWAQPQGRRQGHRRYDKPRRKHNQDVAYMLRALLPAVMAMAISELSGYFYGIKQILFWWGFLSTYNWYNSGLNCRQWLGTLHTGHRRTGNHRVSEPLKKEHETHYDWKAHSFFCAAVSPLVACKLHWRRQDFGKRVKVSNITFIPLFCRRYSFILKSWCLRYCNTLMPLTLMLLMA